MIVVQGHTVTLKNQLELNDPWFAVDKALLEKMPGKAPADLDRLTLSEIDFVLMDPEKFDGHGNPKLTDAEILEWAKERAAMTPRERLKEALEERRGPAR